MAVKINEQTKEKLNGWKSEDGEVKLPFDAPVFWVLNGAAQYKPLAKQSPALYFGGFATGAEEYESLGVELASAIKHEFTPNGAQSSIDVYSTRHLIIAPFAKRLSSVEKSSGARFPGYHKGASPHLQIAAYVAQRTETGTLAPVCPVIITAKGYQVGYILDALREFQTKTGAARRKFADNLRAEMFYCALGTFGDKFTNKLVGTEKQSPITPMSVYLPETAIDEKFIDSFFVGEQVAETLTLLHDECAEWVNAWKSAKQPGQTGAPIDHDEPNIEEPGTEEIPW